MNLLQETKEIQSKMALYCRTGNEVALPGVTPNRFHHYRRLIMNIVEEHLESSFPIAFEYVNTDVWTEMLHDFFSKHHCQSYQVWQIAGEFYNYAMEAKFAEKYNIPFLNNLLKFEWEEVAVYNMADITTPLYVENGNLLEDILIINPEHKLLQLNYPVHTHKPFDTIDKEGTYFVLLYRERETGKVQFVDLSIWFALVIDVLNKGEIALNDLLNEAPNYFGEIKMNDLTESTIDFINDLKKKEFVLGFKK
jgi:hypothetical protein